MKTYEIKAEYVDPKNPRDTLIRRFNIEVNSDTEEEIIEAIAAKTEGLWCDMEFSALYPIVGLTQGDNLN